MFVTFGNVFICTSFLFNSPTIIIHKMLVGVCSIDWIITTSYTLLLVCTCHNMLSVAKQYQYTPLVNLQPLDVINRDSPNVVSLSTFMSSVSLSPSITSMYCSLSIWQSVWKLQMTYRYKQLFTIGRYVAIQWTTCFSIVENWLYYMQHLIKLKPSIF